MHPISSAISGSGLAFLVGADGRLDHRSMPWRLAVYDLAAPGKPACVAVATLWDCLGCGGRIRGEFASVAVLDPQPGSGRLQLAVAATAAAPDEGGSGGGDGGTTQLWLLDVTYAEAGGTAEAGDGPEAGASRARGGPTEAGDGPDAGQTAAMRCDPGADKAEAEAGVVDEAGVAAQVGGADGAGGAAQAGGPAEASGRGTEGNGDGDWERLGLSGGPEDDWKDDGQRGTACSAPARPGGLRVAFAGGFERPVLTTGEDLRHMAALPGRPWLVSSTGGAKGRLCSWRLGGEQ